MNLGGLLSSGEAAVTGGVSGLVSGGLSTLAGAASHALGSIESSLAQQLGIGGGGSPLSAISGGQPSSFIDPRLRPEYQVTILGVDANGAYVPPIIGWLTESFSFGTSSSWSSPFANPVGSEDGFLGSLGHIIGSRWVTQGLSAQFWSGSDAVSFNLPLTFIAETGPQDLLTPIKSLYSLQLPSIGAGTFFTAPGPKLRLGQALSKAVNSAASSAASLLTQTPTVQSVEGFLGISGVNSTAVDTAKADISGISQALSFQNQISLQFGQFMLIPSVVVENVDADFKVKMTADGIPLSVTVNVSFKTHKTPSAEDVKGWFLL